MLQTVDGRENVYVVDFDTMPALPITWDTDEQEPYALALTDAIATGKVTKPGKYGITIEMYVPYVIVNYNIYAIKE